MSTLSFTGLHTWSALLAGTSNLIVSPSKRLAAISFGSQPDLCFAGLCKGKALLEGTLMLTCHVQCMSSTDLEELPGLITLHLSG